MRLLLFVLALIALFGCDPSPSQGDLEKSVVSQQASFAAVTNLIEQYGSVEGSYPSTLEEVEGLTVPTVAVPDRFTSLRAAPISYEVSRDRSFFRLTYGIYDSDDYSLRASSSYLSLNKRWDTIQHLDRLTHVEAAHYGRQYQATLSRDHLTLSALSLLDSAKSNSAYPCRNFWKDWVVRAIGSGDTGQHPLPRRPEIDESVVYFTKDGRPAIAFEFKSKVFPPMTKPLMIVESVYQMDVVSGEWTLLKQCDSSS